MKTNPVKGMCDRGVVETYLRNITLDKIIDYYQRSGFFQIETPIVEDIENIAHSEGGENLKLVFEILRRGEKLERAKEENSSLSDMALRYDLTLPLSRFCASNFSNLILPFKVIQTGRVYRAERPQKGRLREFVQCDIDIIGDDSFDSEIELFSTSLQALYNLGFRNLTLVINDKRILKNQLVSFGVDEEDFNTICITIDKLDKIGKDKVKDELLSKSDVLKTKNYQNAIDEIINWVNSEESRDLYSKSIATSAETLIKIIENLKAILPETFKIQYCPTLVRGQSYYTSTVCEIVSEEFHSSIAGGGRYDGMIAKFLGKKVSAVGISIGFERIMSMILENSKESLGKVKRIALLYSSEDDMSEVLKYKSKIQASEDFYVHIFKDVKNRKKLFTSLEQLGFNHYVNFSDKKIEKFKNTNI